MHTSRTYQLKRTISGATLLMGCALAAIAPTAAIAAQAAGIDQRAIANKLVERMALKPGEKVLLVGVPSMAEQFVVPLRLAVKRAGGEDLGAVASEGATPDSWHTAFTDGIAGKSGAALEQYLTSADVAVMLPGAVPAHPVYAALQHIMTSPNAGHIRTVHFHWAGAYGLDGTLHETSSANAFVYQRALLNTDYAALAAKQRAFEQAMRGKEIRVTTPAGTNLRFRIGDRNVTKQDGNASADHTRDAKVLIDREVELPSGAIRVAPIEGSVNGFIAFPDGEWGGVKVKGLEMGFQDGRVATFTAKQGKEGVEKELASAGDAGKSFREFALGLNPLLAIPRTGERWIPYYGYGAGVVRLSLGDNSELGGAVRGNYVRWNFFTDATVTVGGVPWVVNGRLVR